MSIEIVHELTEDEWRSFVKSHPDGNIFHTPEMFQVFNHTKGYRPELWAAVQDEQILSLFLPVQITLADGIFRSYTTRAVAFGGVLCVPGNEGKDALEKLLRKYAREVKGSPLFTELRNITDFSGIQQILCECGFNFDGHLNYLIDLAHGEATIWDRLNKKTRQHVHKAQNSGLVIEAMLDQHNLAIAYQLMQKVYKRVHVPLANFDLFQSAFDILLPRGMMKAIMVQMCGQYVGFNIFLLYKDRIIDWFRASDRNFSSWQPESLMIWHILEWGNRNNFHYFDFGGAGKSDEYYGPRIFKSRWGGTLVNYGRNTYIHSQMRFKLSKIAYHFKSKYL